MSFIESLTALKEIILIGAAIAGIHVAYKGHGTWKNQLIGKNEYDLARRMSVAFFKYKDALDAVRNPAIWAYEMASPPEKEAKFMDEKQVRHYGLKAAYTKRWESVQELKSHLYSDILESEVIWGSELKNLIKKLYILEAYLLALDPNQDPEIKKASQEYYQDKRDIKYGPFGLENDEFRTDVINCIDEIQNYLKPKLKH